MLRRRCAEFVDVEEWAVQILERGRENERSLLFFPCTAETVWAFAEPFMVHPEEFRRERRRFCAEEQKKEA